MDDAAGCESHRLAASACVNHEPCSRLLSGHLVARIPTIEISGNRTVLGTDRGPVPILTLFVEPPSAA